MTLWAMLAMGLGLMARPAEAAPFAYVANLRDNTVSVIDTATIPPSVVATVAVGFQPDGVAVTPDGKHVYVTNDSVPATVSVIDTASNTVVATVPVGTRPGSVAITPDGKHAYVVNVVSRNVSVIDTATNTVVATVGVGSNPLGVAVTPDGKHAYVTNAGANTVSVIATATNTVVATVAVGGLPESLAIAPDGKHVYVASGGPGFAPVVAVIDTAINTLVAVVDLGNTPAGVAVTPDGKHAYVTDGFGTNLVSVIDTASNTVVDTVAVGNAAIGVAIVPPPPGVPFLAFNAALVIGLGGTPNQDAFALQDWFTLSSTAPAINPLTDAVTLQAGTFAVTIPPGSFVQSTPGNFVFLGSINGVGLEAAIAHTGTLRYVFEAKGGHASFTGTRNPAYVTLTIGGDSGATSVTAHISH